MTRPHRNPIFSAKFAWYDMWIGAFYDRALRVLYVCPLPMCLLVFRLGRFMTRRRPNPLGGPERREGPIDRRKANDGAQHANRSGDGRRIGDHARAVAEKRSQFTSFEAARP